MPNFILPYEFADKTFLNVLKKHEKLVIQSFRAARKKVRARLAVAYADYADNGVMSKTKISSYGRQEKLERDITRILNSVRKENLKDIGNCNKDMFREIYHRDCFFLCQGTNGAFQFSKINTKKITEFLENNTVSKIKWPDSLKENIYEANYRVKSEILQGFARNQKYNRVAKNISDALGISERKSLRIVRTEAHRAQELGHEYNRRQLKDQLVDNEKLIKIWDAVFDKRTRPLHQLLDNKRVEQDEYFSISGYKAKRPGGFGVAKMDINCRCTIRTAIVNSDIKFTEPSISYQDWLDRQSGEKLNPVATSVLSVADIANNFDRRIMQHNSNQFETGYAIDDDGIVLLVKDGKKHSIEFTADEVDKMRNAAIFSHNHPRQSSFSLQDMIFNCNVGAKEIRACRPDGYYFARYDFSEKNLKKVLGELEDGSLAQQFELNLKSGNPILVREAKTQVLGKRLQELNYRMREHTNDAWNAIEDKEFFNNGIDLTKPDVFEKHIQKYYDLFNRFILESIGAKYGYENY